MECDGGKFVGSDIELWFPWKLFDGDIFVLVALDVFAGDLAFPFFVFVSDLEEDVGVSAGDL